MPELENKLAAQASAGEDELVVVTTKYYKNEYGDRLDDVPDNVRRELNEAGADSDPTIKIITYEELD